MSQWSCRYLLLSLCLVCTSLWADERAPSIDFSETQYSAYGSTQLIYSLNSTRADAEIHSIRSGLSMTRIAGFTDGVGPLSNFQLGTQFDTRDDLRRLRYGMRLDFDLPAAGQLYLNLTRPNARREPLSYRYTPTGFEYGSLQKPWGIGLYLDRTSSRSGTLSPQLLFRLDGLLETPGTLEASVQYAHWRSVDAKHSNGEQTMQATVRYRF